jgi:hypothetical protein
VAQTAEIAERARQKGRKSRVFASVFKGSLSPRHRLSRFVERVGISPTEPSALMTDGAESLWASSAVALGLRAAGAVCPRACRFSSMRSRRLNDGSTLVLVPKICFAVAMSRQAMVTSATGVINPARRPHEWGSLN